MSRVFVFVLSLAAWLCVEARATAQCCNGRCSSPTWSAPSSSADRECGCVSGCRCLHTYVPEKYCIDPDNCPVINWGQRGVAAGSAWRIEPSQSSRSDTRRGRRLFFRRWRCR